MEYDSALVDRQVELKQQTSQMERTEWGQGEWEAGRESSLYQHDYVFIFCMICRMP